MPELNKLFALGPKEDPIVDRFMEEEVFDDTTSGKKLLLMLDANHLCSATYPKFVSTINWNSPRQSNSNLFPHFTSTLGFILSSQPLRTNLFCPTLCEYAQFYFLVTACNINQLKKLCPSPYSKRIRIFPHSFSVLCKYTHFSIHILQSFIMPYIRGGPGITWELPRAFKGLLL